MTSTSVDSELLISLVREKPVLWDKSSEDYKSRTCVPLAWRDISQELNPDVHTLSDSEKDLYGKHLMKKWRNIKDQYIKSIKQAQQTNSTILRKRKKYIFHKEMSFLDRPYLNGNESSCEETGHEESSSNFDDSCVAGEVLKQEAVEFVQVEQPTSNYPSRTSPDPEPDLSYFRHRSPTDCRHMMFFRSLLPSLKGFSDDETLQFQSDVISAIQQVKRSRK